MSNLKKIWIPLLLIVLTYPATAQFTLGIKGGFNRAWQGYGATQLPEDARTHVNRILLSTQAYYDIHRLVGIGMEPGYAQRGAFCVPGFVFFNGDTKFLLDYVELPMMVKAGFSFAHDHLSVFGKTGFGASRIFKATQEVVWQDDRADPRRSELPIGGATQFRSMDYGLHGGLGITYHAGNHQLFVESRYYYGLRDFDEWNVSKNRTLHVGIGFARSF